MKTLIYITLFHLIALLSFLFVYFNTQIVNISLGFIQFNVNLALVLVAALISGMLLGYVLSLPARIRLKAQLLKAKKQIKNIDSPVA